MHVQTFGATYDATVALLGLHARSTFVTVIFTTPARPCAAEIAVLLALGPSVQILDLVS